MVLAADFTGWGTFGLGVVTTIGLVLGYRSLKGNENATALARLEVEESHRPAVVPVAEIGGGERSRGRPEFRGDNEMFLPVENIGSGPAFNLEAIVRPVDGAGAAVPVVKITGLGAGSLMRLLVRWPGLREVPGFEVSLTYQDVAGKGWATRARYDAERREYSEPIICPAKDALWLRYYPQLGEVDEDD